MLIGRGAVGGGPGESTGSVSMQAAGDLIAKMLALQADRTGQDPAELLNPAHHHDEHGEIVHGEEVTDG